MRTNLGPSTLFSALRHHLSHLIGCALYADVHIGGPWSVHLHPAVVRGLGEEANGPARSHSKRPQSPSPSPKTLAPWLSIPRELPVSSTSQIKHQLFKHQDSPWRSPRWRLEMCFVDSVFKWGRDRLGDSRGGIGRIAVGIVRVYECECVRESRWVSPLFSSYRCTNTSASFLCQMFALVLADPLP